MTAATWLVLLGTWLAAVVSPGPDFVAVLRASLRGGIARSRRRSDVGAVRRALLSSGVRDPWPVVDSCQSKKGGETRRDSMRAQSSPGCWGRKVESLRTAMALSISIADTNRQALDRAVRTGRGSGKREAATTS